MEIAKNSEGESQEFWQVSAKARTKVEGWPEWKRNLRVTKFSVGLNHKVTRVEGSPCERDKEE
jgi:hypothetical protein